MASDEPNAILERVSELEQQNRISIKLRWVKSEENKADRPGSQIAGNQQGGEDPDPPKPPATASTHATPILTVPAEPAASTSKSKPWSKLVERWKGIKATKPKPQRAKKAKGPSISTRKFKPKHNMIQTSVTLNRPEVELASQRFSAWVPSSSVNVPRATRSSTKIVRDVTLAAFAAGTQSNYSAAIAQWHKYCDDHRIKERDREPAAAHLVEHWVSLHAGDKRGKSLSDWICGLKAWHTVNHLPWLPSEDRLALIRRGVANLQPPARPKRDPMTIQWLDRLSLAADPKDAAEVTVVAAAATGFWGLCRLGELVSSTDKAQQFHNITRAQATESKVFGGVPTMTLNLPRTKTHAQGDTVVIAHQKEECDPIRLLRLHLQQSPCASKEAEKSTPLFAYRDKESLTPLTRTKFISTIGAIGKRAGLGPLHGHSMRIGGCTALLTRGMPPDRVQLHGRWSGDSFKRYIRDHAAVMAPYLVINQVASDRLHRLLPAEWPPAALTTTTNQDGPTPPPGQDLSSRARGRQTPLRTPN
ncbi:hypothetical protein A4X06_0g9488, partial [Tilletia controversa]